MKRCVRRVFFSFFSFLLCLLVPLVGLTACTMMNGSFDCPNKGGVHCQSLDQINAMVDTGVIHGQTSVGVADSAGGMQDIKTACSRNSEFEFFPVKTTFASEQPMRSGETVQRIWVAPYEDTEGNYHKDSVMYAVMQGGHWIGRPVKTVKS